MKRKFIVNLLLLLFLNLLIKPFWVFGIDITVQNMVGSNEYGLYFSLFNFSMLFNIILDVGITNFNNLSISQNAAKINTFFFNIIGLKLVLAIIYALLAITMAFVLGYEARQIHLLLILCLNQFLLSFVLMLRSNVSGLQYYTLDSFLSVLDRLLMITLSVIVIWGHVLHRALQIEDFALIQTFSYATAALIIGVVIFKKIPQLTFTLSGAEMLRIFKSCIPFALLGLLMSVYNRLDGVMLERLLPDGKMHAGIYAQSFRVLEAVSMFAFLFPTLLLPMFSALLGKREDVGSLVRLSFSILFIAAVSFAVTCTIFNKEIIGTLYHEGNAYSSVVFSLLILGFIPIATSYIFGTLLTANGSMKQLNLISLAALITNFSLNMLLIPMYQAKGAAIASLITQGLVACSQLYFTHKLLRLDVTKHTAVRFLFFGAMVVPVALVLHHLPFAWYINFVITGITLAGSALLIGVLPFKDALRAIKRQQWGV